MAVRLLTVEQHQEVVKRLVAHVRRLKSTQHHSAGFEYTSLMVCFLMHNTGSVDALLRLQESLGSTWFPVTAGYIITRSMFETDVTAHYITHDRAVRSQQYISYGRVLKKRQMDACAKHRKSNNDSWREGMELEWQTHWASKEQEINSKYKCVQSKFERVTRKGKTVPFKNWSGKSIREMAVEVDHEEAYDVFYSHLSSFTHANVHLADRFLRVEEDAPLWSHRADESDVGFVFRYAAIFLTCFLELFGKEFDLWDSDQIHACWDFDGTQNAPGKPGR